MLQSIRPNFLFPLSTSLLSIFAMILLSVTAFANEVDGNSPLFSKAIILNGACRHLEVWGDIQIVLTPERSDSIIVEGTASDLNIIGIKSKKGNLSIRAQWINQKETTKIIVPATMLQFVQVYGNAEISSAGYLSIPKLMIVLNGESKVKIQSSGQIKVEAGEGYYLSSTHKPGYKNHLGLEP